MFRLDEDDKEKRDKERREYLRRRELNMGERIIMPTDSLQQNNTVPIAVEPPIENKLLTDDEYRKKRLLYADMSPEERSREVFMKTHKDLFIRPEYTPYRRMAGYAASQHALDNAVDEYYNSGLSDKFRKYRVQLDEKSKQAYKDAVSSGLDPISANSYATKKYGPLKSIDMAMNDVDDEALKKSVSTLASYLGMSGDEYVKEFLKPSLRDRMTKEIVEDATPDNSFEYIMRSAADNSLFGKSVRALLDGVEGGNHSLLYAAGLQNYEPSRLESFASGISSLLIDSPIFGGIGLGASQAVKSVTAVAAERITSRVMMGRLGVGITKEFAKKIAERTIINRLSTKIIQSAFTQGLTLGTYDIANSVADDILNGDNIDLGKAFSSFGKGFATGSALGVVGTPLRYASAGLTGGKKFVASTGILCAESSVFTASTEIEKIMNGVEIAPIDLLYDFAESTATIGSMKIGHKMSNAIMLKIDNWGKLRKELRFTDTEKAELREANVDPDELTSRIEQELRFPSVYDDGNLNTIVKTYFNLMGDSKVSASARSKLMFIVESRLTSTPPIAFDYKISKGRNGNWLLHLYDFEGQKIETRSYKSSSNVYSQMLVEYSNMRKNRIIAYERELTRGFDSQNFIRQAGIYAKEKSIGIIDMSTILYKKATGQQLLEWEEFIVDEVKKRSYYDETGIIELLAEKRRSLEKKYNLDDGSLLDLVDQPFYVCGENANKALDEYASFVKNEVKGLKSGADPSRAAELAQKGQASDKRGLSNEEVKEREVNEYRLKAYGKEPENKVVKPIEINVDENSEYVWNCLGNKNTRADIEAYKQRAQELGKQYGLEAEFITDEREIPRPDPSNVNAVNDYNNQLHALGWQNNGKVFLNLPNLKSLAEVEKTFVHEVVGHSGLSRLFGNHYNDFLEEVYKRADGEVLRGIKQMEGPYKDFDNYTIVEEYLVSLAEKVHPTVKERSLYTRFKDYLRNMLQRLNIFSGNNRIITEKDLEELIKKHGEYMQKRVAPEKYRSKLFKRFKSAHFDEASYTDRAKFEEGQRIKAQKGSLLINTPEYLIDRKAFLNYEFLPEEKKAQYRRRWRLTEAQMQDLLNKFKYRFIGKKGAENIAYYETGEAKDITLNEALELEKKGLSQADIKSMTGWERGVDNEWRKEMTDNRLRVRDYMYKALRVTDEALAREYAALKEVPLEAWGADEVAQWRRLSNAAAAKLRGATLQDIVHDPSFYKAYPELASLPVIIVNSPEVPVRYDTRNKRLVVDRNIFLYPENNLYMSGALQHVIQDYEGFSKAVSMNLIGINSRLSDDYADANKVISTIENAKKASPDFDSEGRISVAFKQKYGFTPEEFKEYFPAFDEYAIYRLTGKRMSFSGDVELRNVMNRIGLQEHYERMIPAENTEDVPRSRQVSVKSLDDLKKYFNGPLDILNEKMRLLHSDEPLRMELDMRPTRRELSPLERSNFEPEYDDYFMKILLEQFKRDRQKQMQNTQDRIEFNRMLRKKFMLENENDDYDLLN